MLTLSCSQYVLRFENFLTITEGVFSPPFPSVGEMFLGCWRLTVAAGEHEFPRRIMYRAEGIDWVRLSTLVSLSR